jgi:hypothetical protein
MTVMTESDFNEIIKSVALIAGKDRDEYIDSLAVIYVMMTKMGDRNAEVWLNELREIGMPDEWMSLRDGKDHLTGEKDLEKRVKSFIGVCLKGSKLSLKQKFIKRNIFNGLKSLEYDVYDYPTDTNTDRIWRLSALYSLTGDDRMNETVLIKDEVYMKLPLYVQWITKYMWG